MLFEKHALKINEQVTSVIVTEHLTPRKSARHPDSKIQLSVKLKLCVFPLCLSEVAVVDRYSQGGRGGGGGLSPAQPYCVSSRNAPPQRCVTRHRRLRGRLGRGEYLMKVSLCDAGGSFFSRFLFVFLQMKILSLSCSLGILDSPK